MAGRLFFNKNHRIAVQGLIYKKLKKEILPSTHKFNLNIDPQIFLPLQTGRISDEEAMRIVSKGNDYIDAFIQASKKNPIYLITSEETNWIQDLLEKEGVKFTDNSGRIDTKIRMKMYYKTFEPDMIISAFSVASGDPDGIYHSLGKNGSIGSPIQYRKEVADLLEEGRKILDIKIADEHYQKVTKATLAEVPFVHLGFTKTVVAYRKDRVVVKQKHKNRNESKLTIYNPI